MANASIDIKEDAAPTKKLASQSFTRGVDTVHQEEVVIGDGSTNGLILGVAAAPLRVDPTGTTTQPVSDGGGVLTVDALDLDIRNLVASQDFVTVTSKQDLTPASPTAASVGVASAQVVAANASRKGLTLINTSNNRISLGFGVAAVLDSGVTLYPQGSFEMDEYSFDLGAVNAIASAAASNLAIQEYA